MMSGGTPDRGAISLVPDSSVPPFEQIRSQLHDLIRSGALPAGHRLPSIRQLAGDLRVAPGTVAPSVAGCQVLDLVLAPLDLDLLGLTVHLDRVHLNITAVPGAGELLGNLLCAVAGLLDSSQLLSLGTILSNLLNSILGILNA
jgi:hypothetical protein